MTITAMRHRLNVSGVVTMWVLTLFSLVPIVSFGYGVLAAACSLTANIIAIALLLSRSVPDRLHGAARLLLQAVVLAAGAVIILRSGIGVDGLMHFVLRQTHG